MQIKTKNKLKVISLGLALALPIGLLGGASFKPADAATIANNFRNDYIENVSVTNGSFANISGTDMSGNSLAGWTAIDTSSDATGMIIDVGSRFSSRRNTYVLSNNPGAYNDADDKVLMINARNSVTVTNAHAKKGYKSNDITLEANSYYKLSVAAKASLDGSDAGQFSAYASIYVSGLKDLENKPIELGYENINNTSYKPYYFFIATGDTAQTITLDLYLGSQYQDSYGVAFFDEVELERYAENTFFEVATNYGYAFSDTLGLDAMADDPNSLSTQTKAKFLVEELQNNDAKLDMTGYNFDFEDEIKEGTNTLGDAWQIVENSPTGHARVMSVARNVQTKYFNDVTRYGYVGNDLSFDLKAQKANEQALVLYNNSSEGFVSVKSKDIDIKAHGIYKFTVQAKISELKSGDFNIIFKENDTIYGKYSISKDDYTAMSGSRSGFKENSDNAFTNDYTTLTFYVKGHNFYDSSINVIFELGNHTTPAEGCVVVDNIEVEYANYSDFSSATDKLELKSYSGDASLNGNFDTAENEEKKLSYPLKASGWEKTIDSKNEKAISSGIIYLKDSATYNEMYTGESFATSYPGNPMGYDAPNNMYMMQNKAMTYQSIKSSSYTLDANKYYKLSFDYLTQSFSPDKHAKIAVEIVDENGITLYYKNGIEATNFKTHEILFHTGVSNPVNINVIIHFGEKNDKREDLMLGTVYLDNFAVLESTQTYFDSKDGGIDLTGYFLNLDPNNTIGYNVTDSQAYTFSVDENYSNTTNSANGGIVSGDANEFGITKDGYNFLALSTYSSSKVSLKSNYKFSLEESKYYKLTFELRTTFTADDEALEANKKEHACKYGVAVGLNGYKLVEGLKSNEEFITYTIYFNSSSASTPNFVFTLNSDCRDTLGTALLTNLNFSEVSDSEYESASTANSYNKTIFTSNVETSEEPEEPNPEEPSTPAEPTGNDSKWLVIPSIIFGVAILVAVIGYLLRKIKIKKIEKIRKESYDKNDINHDAILVKAQAERDEEAAEIREQIKAAVEQRELLEAEHKETVRKAREKSANGKISKDTEREFKTYANKIARLTEKEEILKEQLDTTMSAEYLITIEKRLAQAEEKQLKEMEKLQSGKKKQTTEDNSDEE